MNLPRVLNVLGLEIPDVQITIKVIFRHVANQFIPAPILTPHPRRQPNSIPGSSSSGLQHTQLDISSHTHLQSMRISRDPKIHHLPKFLPSTISASQIHLIPRFPSAQYLTHPNSPRPRKSIGVTSVKVRRATNCSAEELFITCSSILLSAQA
jgi:hypothetical protein